MTDYYSILRALRDQTKTKLSDKEADGYLELVKIAVSQEGDALSGPVSGVCVDILSAVQSYISGSGDTLMFLSPIDERRFGDLELIEAKKNRS